MDLVTQTTILPLLFGCLGIFSLFRLLQRIRSKAYLRNAVVVVTGATSGLGRGKSWGLWCPEWNQQASQASLAMQKGLSVVQLEKGM